MMPFNYATLSVSSLCLAVLIICLCICQRARKWHHFWEQRGVHLLEPVPFFGQREFMHIFNESYFEIIHNLYKKARGRGLKFCCIFQFSTPTLMLIDPRLIGSVLTKDFHYFADRSDLSSDETHAISQQLFSVSSSKWKELSKLISPVVSPGRISYLIQQMENFHESVHLNDSKLTPLVDAHRFAFNFNQEIVGQATLGTKLTQCSSKVMNRVRSMIDPSFRSWCIFYASLVLAPLSKFFYPRVSDKDLCSMVTNILLLRGKSASDENDVFQFFVSAQAKQNKHTRDTGSPQDCHSEDSSSSSIIRQSNNLQDGNIVNIARRLFWFLADSQGTSTVALSWALHLLSLNPECQEKIQRELEQALRERNQRSVTYQVIRDLKYTHTFVKECLRLYTPMAVLQRVCTKDYQLPGTSVVIPKGTKIIIPIYSIQRDAQYFPDPLAFRPDRFDDLTNIAPYTFMPFGEGPRFCIGYRFAMAHLKYSIATLVSKLHIEPVSMDQPILPLHPFSPSILRSSQQILIRFKGRCTESEKDVASSSPRHKIGSDI